MGKCDYKYVKYGQIYNCKRDSFKNEKCILHCIKDDWVLESTSSKTEEYPDYSKFKETLKEEIDKNHSEIYGIIFPKIEIDFTSFNPDSSFSFGEYKYIILCLEMYDCVSYNPIYFDKISSIYLHDCNLTNIRIGERVDKLNIKENSSIYKLHITRDYSIEETNFYESKELRIIDLFLCVDNSNIDDFSSDAGKQFSGIHIFSSSITNLEIKNAVITGSILLEDIEASKIDNFAIENTDFGKNSNINIENYEICNFIIDRIFQESENFNIKYSIISKSLHLSNSNLNNMILDTVDMSSATMNINNCNFIGKDYAIFNNVKWGKFILKGIKNRDILRQLKHVNDQQGNYIQANKFYSLEMEKYGEEVSPFKNFQEWLVFMISKNLSNFSQDWVLPILWFGFMSMFLFNILTIFTISGLDYGDLWFPIQMMFSNFKWVFVLHFLFLFVCLFNSKDYYYILLKRLLGYANLAAFIGSITVYINVWGSFPESLISFEQFIMFANPLQFNLPENYNWLYLVLMILHRLFTFVIGYHLVTALRFHTRRK